MIWVLPPSISSMAVSHCSVAADGKLDFYKQCRCDQHCLGLYLDQFCFRGNTDSSSLCSDNQPLNRTFQGVRQTFKDVCGNQTLGKRTLIWSPICLTITQRPTPPFYIFSIRSLCSPSFPHLWAPHREGISHQHSQPRRTTQI